jgi:ketosteroid isomerase-like protein
MSVTATPREVFESLIGGISAGRWEELADLYAEDTVVDIPFAVPVPTRIEGREQIRAHFAAASGGPVELHACNVLVHETADPEVIVAEFDYQGRVATTDRTFEVSNIQVLRVRDGLIVSTRDFHNYLVFAAAGGRLPELVAALEAGSEKTGRNSS